jgi:hypothetical protein
VSRIHPRVNGDKIVIASGWVGFRKTTRKQFFMDLGERVER